MVDQADKYGFTIEHREIGKDHVSDVSWGHIRKDILFMLPRTFLFMLMVMVSQLIFNRRVTQYNLYFKNLILAAEYTMD